MVERSAKKRKSARGRFRGVLTNLKALF